MKGKNKNKIQPNNTFLAAYLNHVIKSGKNISFFPTFLQKTIEFVEKKNQKNQNNLKIFTWKKKNLIIAHPNWGKSYIITPPLPHLAYI
jgi:hypothetical protein